MRHAVLCLLFPLSASAATCAIPTLQGDDWERNTPEASGMNATALCTTLNAIAQGKDNIHSVIIERHGKLVAEMYRSGKDKSNTC
jgi:hypothetical protein